MLLFQLADVYVDIFFHDLLQKVFTSNIALYMGAGKSDIRIDLQQSENIEQRFKGVISRI